MTNSAIGRAMEILLVEDDLLQARLATKSIQRTQFRQRTTVIGDGQEALDFLFQRGVYRRAPRPDLVLLDLRLPTIDGLDVLEILRADEQLRSIPVVVMTASDDDADRAACELYDAEAYLVKPLDEERFLELLRELKQYWHADLVLPAEVASS